MLSEIFTREIDHATLKDIEEVRHIVKDDAVIDQLEQIIRRHGMEGRFGVFRLHKHFEVNAGESLVETFDPDKRVSTVEAKPIPSDGTAIQSVWRFGSAEPNSSPG